MHKGFSAPYGSPIYGKPPYHMVDARMVRVTYEVDPAAAQAALPPELELVGHTAMAFVGEMTQLPYIGTFHEGGHHAAGAPQGSGRADCRLPLHVDRRIPPRRARGLRHDEAAL
jgi:acetoacetate decarboxylase